MRLSVLFAAVVLGLVGLGFGVPSSAEACDAVQAVRFRTVYAPAQVQEVVRVREVQAPAAVNQLNIVEERRGILGGLRSRRVIQSQQVAGGGGGAVNQLNIGGGRRR